MKTLVTILVALAAASSAIAQNFPDRQVVVVVPFPAGGATDPVARALTQRMSELWKQSVVVLNRAGAGGNIGSESVAKAAPDGHTLLFGTTSLAIGPSLYAKLPFDVLKDFATISQASVAPNILVVHPSIPARSVKELIAIARAKPGQLISASAGTGTSNHLSLVQFVSLANVDITHVPYKGAAPAVVDTVGGHAHMTFAPAPATLSLVQAGRLRAIGVTTPQRFSGLPDIPAIAETVPGYELTSWVGFLAPAATPRAIVMRIHATLLETLRTPAVRDVLTKSGSEPLGNTPEEFTENLKRELPKWNKIVKAAGIKVE